MKSLAKKLVIASGLVAVLGGCTATQNGRGGNETLLGLSLMSLGIQKNNPAAAAVGRGLLNYGAAKAGAPQTNVNVNVNVYGSPTVRKGSCPATFTAMLDGSLKQNNLGYGVPIDSEERENRRYRYREDICEFEKITFKNSARKNEGIYDGRIWKITKKGSFMVINK